MFTDFEFAGKRLSDFGWITCHIDNRPGVSELNIGCDITFNTVKNNHSSIHYATSTSYDNVCTSQPFTIMKNPCDKTNDDVYAMRNEIGFLTKWLNRHEYRKFKPLYDADEWADIHYYGSFNVKEKTINDKIVGLVLTFTGNAPYGFGEHIFNEVDMDSNEITASGESLHITDCASAPILDFTLQGKTEQNTVAGNQLFDKQLLLDNGGVEQADGSIYTPQLNACFYTNSTEEAGQYTMTLTAKKENADANCVLLLAKYTDDTVEYFGSYVTFSTEFSTASFVTNASKIVKELWFTYGEDGNFYVKDVMVNKGATEMPIEEYVGGKKSPNMEYPQKNVSAENVEVKFLSKNIWDKEYASDLNNWYINMNDSANKGYKEIAILIGKGNEITVSYLQTLVGGMNLYAGVTTDNTEPIRDKGWLYHYAGECYINKSITLTAVDDHVYIRFYGSLDNFMQYIGNDLQIEYGDVAADYTPHSKQTFTIPYVLRGVGDVRDCVYLGSKKLVRNIGEYIFTGDEELSNFAGAITAPLLHKSNSEFLFSHCLTGSDVKWANDRYIYFSKAFLGVETNEEFKALLREKNEAGEPFKVVYALSEPIITDLTDKEVEQYKAIMMYYPTTNIINNQGCRMKITYLQDYDNEIIICGDGDEYTTLYPNISITCKRDGDLRIRNTVTGQIFEVLNCSANETIYVNGEHKYIDSDNQNHKNTTLFNDFNYNYLNLDISSENDFNENIYETSIPCKIVIDYSPIRKVGV